MKRYLVFAGAVYYPGGGWDDFICAFDGFDEAVKRATAERDDEYAWSHVVDLTTGKKVFEL